MVSLRAGMLLLCVVGCEKSSTTGGTSAATVGTSAATASAASPASAAPAARDLWEGKYTGTWTAGTAVVGYTAKVKKTAAGYDVDIEADGTQTMTRMTGEGRLPPPASGEGAVMSVHFVACKPDDMFKCNGRAKGDRLFRIAMVPDAYLLRFEKMTAPDDKTKEIPLKKE